MSLNVLFVFRVAEEYSGSQTETREQENPTSRGNCAHSSHRITGKKYWFKSAAGVKRPMLSKDLMKYFCMRQLVCVEYDGLSEDQEREIFQVSASTIQHSHPQQRLYSVFSWVSL